MPWTRQENILRHNLFGDKIIQNYASKISQKYNFNNYPQKNQIYRWVHKFQTTGSVNKMKN